MCNKIHLIAVCSTFFVILATTTYSQSGITASQETSKGMLSIDSENDKPSVTLITDIIYARYGETDLLMHLIMPDQDQSAEPIPIVVYVPGSGWFKQDLGRSIPRIIDFVEQSGYVSAIVSYRPSTIAKSPAQLVDIKSSIRYLRANAGSYNIDPEKLAIWGTSSGGHIASLVGLTEGLDKFKTHHHEEQSSDVQAVIDFFGPTDFLKMDDFPSTITHNAPASPESSVIGGPIQDSINRDKVNEYNPITYITEENEFPPFLIMHGDSDPLVPFNQSLILYEALRDKGHSVSFYKLAGAGHGNRFFTQQTIQVVLDFLERHFEL